MTGQVTDALHLAGTARVGDLVLEVDLTIDPGETVALLGPNGAGKTSLLRVLTGLLPLSGGRLDLAGDLVDQPGSGTFVEPHRRSVGWVPQDRLLFPHLTVRQNIGFSPRATAERVTALLDALGIAGLADRRPSACSGGQAQRIAIARALAAEARILVLDEPVSALDMSIQAQILNLLEDLKADYQLTLMFIAHDLAVIKNVSDRVAVMYLGKLCEVGGADQLYADPAHPYTEILLGANPEPDPEAVLDLESVEIVDLPSPIDPPSGCRFRTRCPRADERCTEEEPQMRQVSAGHHVACHHPLVAVAG